MFGAPLSIQQMRMVWDFVSVTHPHFLLQVLDHLATMDMPWNCPHGRPTMRHLIDLVAATSQSGLAC